KKILPIFFKLWAYWDTLLKTELAHAHELSSQRQQALDQLARDKADEIAAVRSELQQYREREAVAQGQTDLFRAELNTRQPHSVQRKNAPGQNAPPPQPTNSGAAAGKPK
ncbi:MAG: hypothetical protein V4724_22775, partial [Pseudomonadota bacterium]